MTLLTEEEAKQKWCPFARVHHEDCPKTPPYNRFITGAEPDAEAEIMMDGEVRCIASNCMAWRWVYTLFNLSTSSFIKPGDTFQSYDETEMRPTKKGFCGLAGEPKS